MASTAGVTTLGGSASAFGWVSSAAKISCETSCRGVLVSQRKKHVFDPLVAKEIIFGKKQHNDGLRLWEDKEKGRKILKAEFLALLGLQGTSGERCCCFGEG